jgi:poly-gamma-glutamate capsule biosynthesis protein CapA/YwtB (metallophosphatase superfamily)
MVNESKPVDLALIKQRAADGHFRAIALWINELLVPQGIYAQVQADRQPGCLKILVEFKRPPRQEALMQMVCRRLWGLNSPIIEGVHVIARPIGQSRTLWQRRVKIPTPLQRQHKQQRRQQKHRQQKHRQWAIATPPAPSPQAGQAITATAAPAAPPQPPVPRPRQAIISPVIRPNDKIQALAKLDIQDPLGSSLRAQRRRRALRRSRRASPTLKFNFDQHFKFARATIVTGSAAAAFILGCLTEVVISGNGPSLPQWGTPAKLDAERDQTPDPEATEVAFNRSEGPQSQFGSNHVEAALEPVAVIPHHQVSNPSDPTVTLLFGGEVSVGALDWASPDQADQILSQLPAYQQADVAMVNLGNSLATAGTSIQENYHHRTRPEAVAALKQGGVDIVSLTSERTMEYGVRGLTETLETLDQEGIYRVGAGRDQREARRPEILDVKGQRIAYLGFVPDNVKTAAAKKADINTASKETIIEDIAAIRNEVDWVVVNYRWLGDLTPQPDSKQIEFSRAAIDAGADLVVGYHPYQLQGAELYKDRPIVYALGDFIFPDAPLDDHDTVALKVSLRQAKMKVEFLPVTVRDAKPQAALGQHGETILQNLREASRSLASPLNFPIILDTPKDLKPETAESVPEMTDKILAPIKSLGEIEPGQPTTPTPQAVLSLVTTQPARVTWERDISTMVSLAMAILAMAILAIGIPAMKFPATSIRGMAIRGMAIRGMKRLTTAIPAMAILAMKFRATSIPAMAMPVMRTLAMKRRAMEILLMKGLPLKTLTTNRLNQTCQRLPPAFLSGTTHCRLSPV